MTTAQIAALPKADLHVHQEWRPRLDRVLARQTGRPPHNWVAWRAALQAQHPPGVARLAPLGGSPPIAPEADADPARFIARIADLLTEAAADGAVYVEVRFGPQEPHRPDFMACFRQAEQRVQQHYPTFRAEALVTLLLMLEPLAVEASVQACLAAAHDGLAGIDFLYTPYDSEADWRPIYRIAERLAAAGLGITAHAGEFSPANIRAALQVPGLTRLGHATYAAADPALLAAVAHSHITLECCLTSNVVLGAVPTYAAHPLPRFLAAGIPLTLATDDPVQLGTTIGQEYAIAHTLGCSETDLAACTHHAVQAAFTTPARRAALQALLAQEL